MNVKFISKKFIVGNYCKYDTYIINVDGKAYRISNYCIQNPKKFHKIIRSNTGEEFAINTYNSTAYKILNNGQNEKYKKLSNK